MFHQHDLRWWEMAAVGWSASYINRMGKLFFFFYKVVEENSRLRAVEWLRVCFEWLLLDSCSSNNGRHGYRGGKQTCQSRRSQYTSIWGSCQLRDRCWLGCPQRLRLEEVAGGGGGRENDSSTSFDLKSLCLRVYKTNIEFLLSEQEPEPEDHFGNQSEPEISGAAWGTFQRWAGL